MPQASAHKMFVIYDEPFWRADGLNAQLISDVGPARMSNDSCMPDEPGPGIILASSRARTRASRGAGPPEQRQDALRDELAATSGRARPSRS